jgi:hypothetical protein
MNLLHILPRVPPAVCGVADYAWNLAEQLELHEGIQSTFLSAGTSWTYPGPEPHFPVHHLPRMSAHTFDSWLCHHGSSVDALLLHLSPYGFQKRAIPFGLANAWSSQAAKVHAPLRLTYFHELFASGPPTTSAFWLQPLQKFVLRRIARASNARATNRENYARWLDRHCPADSPPTQVMPVFSSLGELADPPPLSARSPDMVLFASANHSSEPLEVLLQRVTAHAGKLGLKRLHIIGGKQEIPPPVNGIERVRHGYLSPEQVSDILSRCRVGYTAYSPDYLGKSSLFATFAAHGLAVITQGRNQQLPDGLTHGRHLLNEPLLEPEAPLPTADALQTLASALHLWYESHNQRQTATRIATALRSLTPKT